MAEKSADDAPEGYRLLTEEQRADILSTLNVQLRGIEKEIEKRFPAHRNVPRSQSKVYSSYVFNQSVF